MTFSSCHVWGSLKLFALFYFCIFGIDIQQMVRVTHQGSVGRPNMVRCASDGVFERYPSERVGRELVNFQGLVLSQMTMSVMVYGSSGSRHRRNYLS